MHNSHPSSPRIPLSFASRIHHQRRDTPRRLTHLRWDHGGTTAKLRNDFLGAVGGATDIVILCNIHTPCCHVMLGAQLMKHGHFRPHYMAAGSIRC